MSSRLYNLLLLGAVTTHASAGIVGQNKTTCSGFKLNAKGFYDHLDPENFTLATVVQSPFDHALPIDIWTMPQSLPQAGWNVTIATQRAAKFIREAAADGVGLLSFSEVWFPGYPFTMMSDPSLTQSYIDNSLGEGDANWNTLVDTIKEVGIYVAIGVSERRGEKLHMTQVLWSPEGEKLIHRQKLRPSEYERNLWSDGTIDGFHVVPTPYGRIGMLECWEHLHAQMTFPMQAQLEDIHIAMYPGADDPWVPEDPATITHPFGSSRVGLSGVTVYTATVKSWSVVSGIGGGIILNPIGVIQKYLPASEVATAPTYVSYSVNTTTFRKGRTYEINSQFGFGSLLEILQSYPSYIPKDRGTWILPKTITISELLNMAAAGIKYFSGADSAESPL